MSESLATFTTDELLDELKTRYPLCVFTGLREAVGQKGTQQQERILRWFGCTPTAIGLLEIGKTRIILKDLYEKAEPIDDDDET